MLSKENKLNDYKHPVRGMGDDKLFRDKENVCLMRDVAYDDGLTQEKTYILDVGFKSIKYVCDELQLKTIEIISDIIDLGVPIECLDDIVLEGVKKYYGIMCENKNTDLLNKDFKEKKGEQK